MAIYYVDTASAGGDGTTQALSGDNAAFATIAEVNGASFSAGDSVLFKRGCTWREQLTVPSSGSDGSPMSRELMIFDSNIPDSLLLDYEQWAMGTNRMI
jgi:hypothetical protein